MYFDTFSGLFFLLIIGMFVFVIANGLLTWSKNEASPRLSVPAIVRTKRKNVDTHMHHHHEHPVHHTTSTSYYVTFEFESGDRLEFRLSGREYGQLAEGDRGVLTFQGTRYLGFKREAVSE